MEDLGIINEVELDKAEITAEAVQAEAQEAVTEEATEETSEEETLENEPEDKQKNEQEAPAQEEERDKVIEDRLLKHLLSMLYSCRAVIAENMAASLNMPLENVNRKTGKDSPVNNVIIDAEAVSADDEKAENENAD